MKKLIRSIVAAALVASPGVALAQTASPQERYQLVKANVAGSDQSGTFTATYTTKVYGGRYIFSQACTAYGSVTLNVVGPDGSTNVVLSQKTQSDSLTSASGEFDLGSFAVVSATVSGTTGCNAILSRVP